MTRSAYLERRAAELRMLGTGGASMRHGWMWLTLAGCCELPFDLPGQQCDGGPTDTTTTSDTGDTRIPLTGFDLTVRTGDEEYDRYTQAIWGLPRLAGPGGGSAQLMQGIAGLYDTSERLPQPFGLAYVKEGQVPSGAVERYLEHWFLDVAPQGYDGTRSLSAESSWEPGAGWNVVLGEMPNWLSGTYENRAYVCQDVVYTAVPSSQDLTEFEYINPKNVPDRYTFDVTQNGQWRGSLLRERHNHLMLGEIWVDFWTFTQGYELVGPKGAASVDFDLVTVDAPPLNLWILDSPPAFRFARVIYKVLPGSLFDPDQADLSCDYLFEL